MRILIKLKKGNNLKKMQLISRNSDSFNSLENNEFSQAKINECKLS